MVKLICIVDDEEEIVQNLAAEIKEHRPEWKLMAFNSGLEAIKEIMKGQVSLVITDIAMPDMDGYELFWRIKGYDANIPVIMMTGFGYDPSHVLVRSKKEGLRDILYKPFETSKLIELIELRLNS
ncbi:MAG: response regulator [Candidatus Cloacimonetes bacterium]|nr:response regulator [Candidatus Cloacimonadota bacterium]